MGASRIAARQAARAQVVRQQQRHVNQEVHHVGRKNTPARKGVVKHYPRTAPIGPPLISRECRDCEPGYLCAGHWSTATDAERRAVLRERANRPRGGAR